MKVEFYPLESNIEQLQFVVIQARYQGQWIFGRHKGRSTWELPGGHIEEGEAADSAAKRELQEETGAIAYDLESVCNYSVDRDGITSYGRLYFAEVTRLGPLEYEIEEISLHTALPDHLTYSQIQPYLFDKVMMFIT